MWIKLRFRHSKTTLQRQKISASTEPGPEGPGTPGPPRLGARRSLYKLFLFESWLGLEVSGGRPSRRSLSPSPTQRRYSQCSIWVNSSSPWLALKSTVPLSDGCQPGGDRVQSRPGHTIGVMVCSSPVTNTSSDMPVPRRCQWAAALRPWRISSCIATPKFTNSSISLKLSFRAISFEICNHVWRPLIRRSWSPADARAHFDWNAEVNAIPISGSIQAWVAAGPHRRY